eukprot:2523767-Rhodomonas_salina.1
MVIGDQATPTTRREAEKRGQDARGAPHDHHHPPHSHRHSHRHRHLHRPPPRHRQHGECTGKMRTQVEMSVAHHTIGTPGALPPV